MEKKTITFYLFMVALVGVAAYGGNAYKNYIAGTDYKEDYEVVKMYLLNDSPLYGKNRPKLWIHSKYEINARKWKNFQSRNSTDLNQPYLFLTIQSIINHCGNNFHICLIDDDSFNKLIPGWDINISSLADPMKSQARDIAMLQLVYHYGGMVVPNSFLCTKNLVDLYQKGTLENKPFFVENHNRHCNLVKEQRSTRFIADVKMMGAKKHSEIVRHLVDLMKSNLKTGHFSQHNEFEGSIQHWLQDAHTTKQINVIDGEYIGIKTKTKKPILVEDLMEENYLDIDNSRIHGILIPSEDILTRPKYQWFAVLPKEDILESRMIISKMMKASIVDSMDEYHRATEINSLLAI
jgi:hypothetical protein